MKNLTYFLLIVAATTIAFSWFSRRSAAESAAPAPGGMELVAVRRGDISQTVESSATITPENKLDIKPPIAGRAEAVLVDIGQEVKRGQTLAMMSSSERAALLDAARAKGPKEVAFWEDVYQTAPLVAPLDGVIISRTLVPGQVVTTADIAFIMSDRLIAKASMDETDLAKVRLGQAAIVTLDSYPDHRIDGEVSKIAYNGATTNNVTTYPVDVMMKQVPDFARSGMTASVGFVTETKNDVLLLPSDALDTDGNVRLPAENAGDEPVKKHVRTGISDGKNVEIVEGVAEGQQVLRTVYRLPEQNVPKGFSLLPRPTRGRPRGSPTPSPSPPP